MTLSKYNEVMEKITVSEEMRSRILQNVEKKLDDNGSVGEDRINENSTEIMEIDSNESGADNSELNEQSSNTESSNSGINDPGANHIESSNLGKNDQRVNASAKIIRFIRSYGSKVAIFALIIAGSYGVIRMGLLNNNSESATSSSEYAAETTESADYAYEATEEAADNSVNEYETEDNSLIEEEAAEYSSDDKKEAAGLNIDNSSAEAEAFAGTREESSPMQDADESALAEAAMESTEEADSIEGNTYEDDADSDQAAEQTVGTPDKNIKSEDFGTSVDSEEELAKALGYDFKTLTNLDSKADHIYYSYYEDLGEIQYTLEDNSVYYYISDNEAAIQNKLLGTDSFTEEDGIVVDDKTIAVYADYYNRKMAIWQDEDLWYGIKLYPDLDVNDLEEIIKE